MHRNINCFFRCWIRFERESHGYYGTARLWDDGIILPQDTRKVTWRCTLVSRPFVFSLTHSDGYFFPPQVLGQSLRAALSSLARRQTQQFGVFRMWRKFHVCHFISSRKGTQNSIHKLVRAFWEGCNSSLSQGFALRYVLNATVVYSLTTLQHSITLRLYHSVFNVIT